MNPIDWSGIKNADGTPGTVTDTGNTQYNSRQEQMKIYAGSWTGTGNASAYINEGGSLTKQGDMVKSHTHGMAHYHNTNINHGHEISQTPHSHGIYDFGTHDFNETTVETNVFGATRIIVGNGQTWGGIGIKGSNANVSVIGTGDLNKPSTNSYYHGTTIDRNSTDSNNDNANENRPENFTVKIWKRTA